MASPPKSIMNSQQFKRFLSAINNPKTRFEYLKVMRYYTDFLKAKSIKDLMGSDDAIEKRIEKWIDDQKSRGVKGNTIKTRYNTIKLFYEMNRRNLSWKIISKTIPKAAPHKDKGWERPQIQKLLESAGKRDRAMILLFASTGMRKGVVPSLNKGHFRPLDDHGIFIVNCYHGEIEEYETYTTPECRQAIEEYWRFRQSKGETMTDNSPAFRKEWNQDDAVAARKPIRMTERMIDQAMREVAIDSGLRIPRKTESVNQSGRVRHEQKLVHGFRKFYETTLLDLGFDQNWVDALEGHKMKGLRSNYYRFKDKTVLLGAMSEDGKYRKPGYADLMPELVINDQERLRLQNADLKKKIIGEAEIKKQMDKMQSDMDDMAHELYRQTRGEHPMFKEDKKSDTGELE